jgi:hypothetical protein
MIELTDLDKKYLELCTEGMSAENKKEERERLIEKIEELGHIVEKLNNSQGFSVFFFTGGHRHTVAPRGHKFSCPLIPEGLAIKSFIKSED